jgi:hypothetical protein
MRRLGDEDHAMRLRECRLAAAVWILVLLAGCSAQTPSRDEAPVQTRAPATKPDSAQKNASSAGTAAQKPAVQHPAAKPPTAQEERGVPSPAVIATNTPPVAATPPRTPQEADDGAVMAAAETESVKRRKAAKKRVAPAPQSSFPWPPPRPSVAFALPRTLLWRALSVSDASHFAARQLGDFDTMLSAAMERAGYMQRSYYLVPGGFALATQLERIGDDGRSAVGEARWALEQPQPAAFSLAEYLKALFAAAPGRFRIVVLVVSSMPFTTSDVEPGVDTARAWVTGGMSALPLDIAAQPYGPNGGTQALVYEFEKPPGGSAQVKTPGHISAQGHLAGIQLLTNLAP